MNFYVVLCGRQTGVFYRWCDVEMSVGGYQGAKFKRFECLTDAQNCFDSVRQD